MITLDSLLAEIFVDPLTSSDEGQQRYLSRTAFLNLLTPVEFVADLLTGTGCMALTCMLPLFLHQTAHVSIEMAFMFSAGAGLAVTVLSRGGRSTNLRIGPHRVDETAQSVRASGQALLLLLPVLLLSRTNIHPASAAIGFALMPFMQLLQKEVMWHAIRRLHRRGHGIERVVVYGRDATVRRVIDSMLQSHRLAYAPVVVIDEHARKDDQDSVMTPSDKVHPVLLQGISPTPKLLRSLRCNTLLIAEPLPCQQIEKLRAIAADAGASVAHVMHHPATAPGCFHCTEIDGMLLMREEPPQACWLYACGKRMLDIAVSSLLLLLLSPLFLLIALLIRFTSHGPAFFIQERVGRDGSLFRMYKFRSMQSDVSRYQRSPKSPHDTRITAIGRLLRRTSLDELPQLLNVFLGQMSLVGPRPEMPFIVRRYNAYQRLRLQVTPGLTGLWQLSADRAFAIHENLHHDFTYIRHRSLSLDIAILIHTLFFAMGGGI